MTVDVCMFISNKLNTIKCNPQTNFLVVCTTVQTKKGSKYQRIGWDFF